MQQQIMKDDLSILVQQNQHHTHWNMETSYDEVPHAHWTCACRVLIWMSKIPRQCCVICWIGGTQRFLPRPTHPQVRSSLTAHPSPPAKLNIYSLPRHIPVLPNVGTSQHQEHFSHDITALKKKKKKKERRNVRTMTTQAAVPVTVAGVWNPLYACRGLQ